MKPNGSDSPWTDEALAGLRGEYGDFFTGRTCLVTGADGFMGSHLTEALVALDANVQAFVRATSSGALNRSEEHTSEPQSQSNLVCRLLLEKKNRSTQSAFEYL